MPVDSIKIGSRIRKDLGDITSLAENIMEIGLLYRELICGSRRIEAFLEGVVLT
jgi:hypothetical protein